MSDHPESTAQRNRAEQARLYGAPLVDVVNELTETFGISRAQLARVLGLSAPMISQLASGNRLKIGNPSAVQRLQSLMQLAPEVRTRRMDAAAALADVESEATGNVLTRTTAALRHDGATNVQEVLRWAASADELAGAADLLATEYPALAEVLRIYGNGRTRDAVEHFRQVSGG